MCETSRSNWLKTANGSAFARFSKFSLPIANDFCGHWSFFFGHDWDPIVTTLRLSLNKTFNAGTGWSCAMTNSSLTHTNYSTKSPTFSATFWEQHDHWSSVFRNAHGGVSSISDSDESNKFRLLPRKLRKCLLRQQILNVQRLPGTVSCRSNLPQVPIDLKWTLTGWKFWRRGFLHKNLDFADRETCNSLL